MQNTTVKGTPHDLGKFVKLTLPGGVGSCGGAEKFSGCFDIFGSTDQACKTSMSWYLYANQCQNTVRIISMLITYNVAAARAVSSGDNREQHDNRSSSLPFTI